MSIETFIVNLVIILFPIFTNVIYELYIKNSGKKENDLLLDITLISSLYLLISSANELYLILLNIIFLVSLIKKRIFPSIIISILIILVYSSNGFPYFVVLLMQLISYLLYILYYKFKKSKLFINLFIITEIVFAFIFNISTGGLSYINVINSILISTIFSLATYLVIYILKISEDIVRLNMTIKGLEREKQIRESLFKITHEIKNPIAVCKSYLDMLDFNNKEHEKYIPILKEEINNILVLLQDFACMSKIKIQKEILDINLLLEDITRQLKPILNDDDIDFITNISDDELYIEGDYNRLSQVLVNVIKNSKEAKDKNKKSYVSLKTDIKDNYFIITIEDNGIGISKSDIAKFKEPFYTTKKNGTGLGVSLSLEIIKAHNGKMDFISEENVGTKVIIKLPLRPIKL